MSDAAPVAPRSQRVAETQPVRAPAQAGSGAGDQQASQQTQTAAPTDTKSSAPAFKEPAISLSPRVAGINVGDVVEGKVERIDAQARAVLQNSKETLLVDPAAGLKSGTQAKVRVTQTVPQFLGQLLAQGPKAVEVPVRLALVAVRGLDMAQTEPQPSAAPAAKLPPALAAQANRTDDFLKTLTRPMQTTDAAAAPKTETVAAAKQASTTVQPTLMQALVSKSETQVGVNAVFAARHPQIESTPKALTMTLLPASQSQMTYLRPPAASSPIGALIASGRAIMATVTEQQPTPQAANARVTLEARGLRIEIPDLPDVKLRPRERIVLLSANAKPIANAAPRGASAAPQTQPLTAPPVKQSPIVPTLWPPLHNVLAAALSQAPGPNTALLGSRTTQLLSAVLGLNQDPAETSAAKPVAAPNGVVKIPLQESDAVKSALTALRQSQPELEQVLKQQLDAAVALSTSPASARPEPAMLPLVIPNSENSLIASLFLYPAQTDAQQTQENANQQTRGNDQAKDFDVSLTFERFGKTRLSGRFERGALSLTVETQSALPEALTMELAQLLNDRCEACHFTGTIGFQSAE